MKREVQLQIFESQKQNKYRSQLTPSRKPNTPLSSQEGSFCKRIRHTIFNYSIRHSIFQYNSNSKRNLSNPRSNSLDQSSTQHFVFVNQQNSQRQNYRQNSKLHQFTTECNFF